MVQASTLKWSPVFNHQSLNQLEQSLVTLSVVYSELDVHDEVNLDLEYDASV